MAKKLWDKALEVSYEQSSYLFPGCDLASSLFVDRGIKWSARPVISRDARGRNP